MLFIIKLAVSFVMFLCFVTKKDYTWHDLGVYVCGCVLFLLSGIGP